MSKRIIGVYTVTRCFAYAHKIYRPLRALEEEYRMLPVKNYAVFYIVREQEEVVETHRVIHARMDFTKLIK